MDSYRNLIDRIFPQVNRILFTILAYLNKGIVWMVFTRPLLSWSTRPCSNTTGISITFMFNRFFKISLASYWYLLLFDSILCTVRTPKSTFWHVILLLLLTITRSGYLAETR